MRAVFATGETHGVRFYKRGHSANNAQTYRNTHPLIKRPPINHLNQRSSILPLYEVML